MKRNPAECQRDRLPAEKIPAANASARLQTNFVYKILDEGSAIPFDESVSGKEMSN